MIENEEKPNEDVTVTANEDGLLVSTPNDIEDKLAEVRRKLGLNTIEDYEQGKPEPFEQQEQQTNRPSGADVDWSGYDLPTQYAHLYPRQSTTLLMTEEGPKWVAIVDDFYALRAPYPILGLRIAQMVNGPEDWRLMSAVVPAGQFTVNQCKQAGLDKSLAGAVGVVTLQRKVKVKLPTPMILKSEQDDTVAAPADEELKATEDASLAWIEKEAANAFSAPNSADTPSETPVNAMTRAIGATEGTNPEEILGVREVPGARTAAKEAVNG